MKRLYENGRLNADEKTVALRTQGELTKDAYINDDDVIKHHHHLYKHLL